MVHVTLHVWLHVVVHWKQTLCLSSVEFLYSLSLRKKLFISYLQLRTFGRICDYFVYGSSMFTVNIIILYLGLRVKSCVLFKKSIGKGTM